MFIIILPVMDVHVIMNRIWKEFCGQNILREDWASSEHAKFEPLEKQQREALNISFSFWESENCQVKFDLQHLVQCVSDFAVDNKSKWSMCDATTCTGDKRDEEQILCETCRRWFHKNCLPCEVGEQPLDTYFKCTTSLSARNQSWRTRMLSLCELCMKNDDLKFAF